MAVHEHDVLVLGGGPAGSLTAALIRRQAPQLSVRVLERERFPRHHVGEVTLPGWAPILRRAGALEKLDAALPIKKLGVVFRWGPAQAGESWTADFREEKRGAPAEASWHVDRAQLDQLLLDNARDQGAQVDEGARVVRVDGQTVHWVDGTGEHQATARWIVDATGQARLLARLWKLPVHRHADMSNMALYGYWSGSRLTDSAAIERVDERWALVNTSELGWVWHIPIAPDIVSVGLVTHRDGLTDLGDVRKAYLDAVAATPGVGDLLADAVFLGDRPAGGRDTVAVAEDWSYRVENVCGSGYFLVGDAAVFVDPVLSSGLTLAANGASMVANAITTMARGDVDEDALLASYARTYGDIASGYHRMARVWYGRNLRADSWHWQARRERLKLGQALHESDAEAFTAVCLGVIASPLDAAIGRASQDGWGSEFFNWLVTDHLFAAPNADFDGVSGGDAARQAGRRSIARRWRSLVGSRLRLTEPLTPLHGFHTHRFLDHWRPVTLARIGDVTVPDVGLLCLLDGTSLTLELIWKVLGRDADDAAISGVVHTLLQLDMLGLLDSSDPSPPPPWSGSPTLALAAGILGAVDQPGPISFEVGLLGDRLQVTVDGRRLELRRDGPRWRRGDRTLDRIGARLQRVDDGVWSDLASRAGMGLRFDHVPGQRPKAQPL